MPQGEAEVTEMINASGAPIDQADAEIIRDYLNGGHS
jgi:hypothetical protein